MQHRLAEHFLFEPIAIEEIQVVHDPPDVQQVFGGLVPNGHGEKVDVVAEPNRWTVGSMVAAAEDALGSGIK